MTRQRKRGLHAQVWRTTRYTDRRGNTTEMADPAGPLTVRCAIIPQRSARAEVPGQQQINVVRMIVGPELTDLSLWSRVEVLGKTWDVVTPPAYRHGSRRTRHWSLDLRERPS